jgi:hypothetical protein
MRALPRTSASPAFTREVMRKLHRQPERKPLVWRFAAMVAMAACLIAVVNIAVLQQRQQERTLALRAERQKLEAELEAVKQSARDAEPMVVLENDQGTRVIMDLDSAIQPAAMQYD